MKGNEGQPSRSAQMTRARDYFSDLARRFVKDPDDQVDFAMDCVFRVVESAHKRGADDFDKELKELPKIAAEELAKYHRRIYF